MHRPPTTHSQTPLMKNRLLFAARVLSRPQTGRRYVAERQTAATDSDDLLAVYCAVARHVNAAS